MKDAAMTRHEQLPDFAWPARESHLVSFWNETLAPKFVRFRHILTGGLSRHSEAVFPRLDLRAGDRVIDVGCGFGDTTLEIGRRVGPGGMAFGIDCCPDFLRFGMRDLADSGAGNVAFAAGDAETGLPDGAFDVAFSRFGTMFFANPVAGLRSMRRALRPGGRIAHIVWRDRADNPWLSAATEVLLRHLPRPDGSADSCGPGPFSMSDQNLLSYQMRAAGFRDIAFRRIDAKVMVGRSVEEAVAFQLAIGPAGEVFRNAGAFGELHRPALERYLKDLFAAQPRDDQGIWMDSSSWLVTAEA